MKNKEAILEFLKSIIAREVGLDISAIQGHSSFHQLGLDSVNSLFLLNEVEEHLQMDIDPLSLYDNPTLDSFSDFIVSESVDVARLWKPSNPEFIADPFPIYQKILKHSSVFKSQNGDYVIMSFEANRQILRDPSFLSGNRIDWVMKMDEYAQGKSIEFSFIKQMMGGTLTQLDSSKHTLFRNLLAKNWPKQDVVISMTESISNEIIVSLDGSCDLSLELSKKIPLYLISDLMGIDRRLGFEHMGDAFRMVDILDPYLTLKDVFAIEKASENLIKMIQSCYNDPIPGSIVDHVKKSQETLDVEESDVISLLVFLFIAGFETNSALISRCLHLIITNEEIASQLSSEESLIDPFVKEVLRLWTPVQITGRKTSKEETIGGVTIPEGSSLTLCIGAANRDPNYYIEPDKLILNRLKKDHLSFGYGAHQCLGSNIALIEARTIVKKILPMRHQVTLIKQPKYKGKLAVNSSKEMMVHINKS